VIVTSRRSIGFIQLEWTCPNCSTRNPGGNKTCTNCGAPQPENVQFERPAEEKIVTDEKALQSARAGADIHCGFCGTRNPATATICSQCGGDLKEGQARQAGRLMDAAKPAPNNIKCTNCGTENPPANTNCSNCGVTLSRPAASAGISAGSVATSSPPPAAMKKPNLLLIGGIAAGVLACCVGIALIFFLPTTSVEATVSDVHWQSSVPVEEVRAVSYDNERGSPPSDAYNVSCDTQSQEVCEQKTVDKGNGYAEVVEDCHTETDQYCDYTREEWTTIQTYTLDGHDYSPIYEQPSLSTDQRLGNETVTYTVTFQVDNGIKNYNPDDLNDYQQFQIGDVWILKLNALGGVVSVER
jgi:membrane protease subunit (stomatin/prohibitin family)